MRFIGRDYCGTTEACKLAGTNRQTFLRWVKQGKFTDVEHRDGNGWRLFTDEDIRRLRRTADTEGVFQKEGGLRHLARRRWMFLSRHSHVLAYIARHPQSTVQAIAHAIGLSIRAVQLILDDLEEGGYISRQKEGRSNRYLVHPEMPLRHRLTRHRTVGELLVALGAMPATRLHRQYSQKGPPPG